MFLVFRRCLALVIFLFWSSTLLAQDVQCAQHPKVGLVLSGGGAKGLAHIGVIKVLEKAGIPIDYIGGTSMGAIIGGLYAIGYSSYQLDSLVKTTDWDELLSDKVPRRSMSMIEKDDNQRYLFAFPIREKKISMPAAIVQGQNISMLFTKLTSPVYHQADFSKFSIPFLCVATDIENGQQVVIRTGNLASAMRASMAIPTVFTPEGFKGQLMLDGGLINNFPVQEVKAMGADLIIGVDVGFRFFNQKELNSFVRIIEQSVFMHSMESLAINRDSCTVFIDPDLKGYNVSSFTKADSLISRGEKAALAQWDSLQKLGLYLQSFNHTLCQKRTSKVQHPINKIFISKIRVEELQNVPTKFLLRKIPFTVPSEVSLKEIESFIETIYGTAFFDRITYRFEENKDGICLVLDAHERNTNFFRVGLHYDSDFNTSLLLNTTYRNLFIKGAKLSLDMALGEHFMLSGLLYHNTGWNIHNRFMSRRKLIPDYGLRVKFHALDYYLYQNNQKISSYKLNNLLTEYFVQMNPGNNLSLKLGAMIDFSKLNNQVSLLAQSPVESTLLNTYFMYRRDSYNYAFYANKGARVNFGIRYVHDIKLAELKSTESDFWQAFYIGNYVIPLGQKLSYELGVMVGTSQGDSILSHYRFYPGGQTQTELVNQCPFTGMHFMQLVGEHMVACKLNFQWEMWGDNFLITKSNLGEVADTRTDLMSFNNWAWGYGLAFAYRSPIGPMEISYMSSNTNNHKPMFFINVGYNF